MEYVNKDLYIAKQGKSFILLTNNAGVKEDLETDIITAVEKNESEDKVKKKHSLEVDKVGPKQS